MIALIAKLTSRTMGKVQWQGKQAAHIEHFKDEMRMLSEMMDQDYTDQQKVMMLSTCASDAENLRDILKNHTTSRKAAGNHRQITFDEYCKTLLDAANSHDYSNSIV